jgi:hypothetical protein
LLLRPWYRCHARRLPSTRELISENLLRRKTTRKLLPLRRELIRGKASNKAVRGNHLRLKPKVVGSWWWHLLREGLLMLLLLPTSSSTTTSSVLPPTSAFL